MTCKDLTFVTNLKVTDLSHLQLKETHWLKYKRAIEKEVKSRIYHDISKDLINNIRIEVIDSSYKYLISGSF